MKTHHIILILAGLAIVAAGCAIHGQGPGDPVAKYVITFTNVKLTDPDGFKKALTESHHPRWQKDLILRHKNLPPESLIGPSEGAAVPPIVYTASIAQTTNQGSNPDSLHVTQRVGLNNLSDVKKLLTFIEQQ
jgi:hypothetical protein